MKLQASGDGGARIEIYDNGPGIDPDRREDIFLPFYTTRPDGTGVGLSFARQIVVAHGGTIPRACRRSAERRLSPSFE